MSGLIALTRDALTRVDTDYARQSPRAMGVDENGYGYIYLQIGSSTDGVAVAAGSCVNGRPALWTMDATTAKCYGGMYGKEAQAANCKMVIGMAAAAIGSWCWFMFRGYHSAVKKSGTAVTAGQQVIFESLSITASRKIHPVGVATLISLTQRIQGYINTATSAAATTCGMVLYGY